MYNVIAYHDVVDGFVTIHNLHSCVSANRVFVQDNIYESFASKLAKAMDKDLKLGNGLDIGTTLGPLINERAVNKVSFELEPIFGCSTILLSSLIFNRIAQLLI